MSEAPRRLLWANNVNQEPISFRRPVTYSVVNEHGNIIVPYVYWRHEATLDWKTYVPLREKYPQLEVLHWRDEQGVLRPTEAELADMVIEEGEAYE